MSAAPFTPSFSGRPGLDDWSILVNRLQKQHGMGYKEAVETGRRIHPEIAAAAYTNDGLKPAANVGGLLQNRLKAPFPEPSGDEVLDVLLRAANFYENVQDMQPVAAFEKALDAHIPNYEPAGPAAEAHLAKLKRAAGVPLTRGQQYAADVEATAGPEAAAYMRRNFFLNNRAFSPTGDGWVEVAKVGEWPHSSGVVQVIDAAALQAMVAAFQKARQQPNFPGVLIDFEHFSSDPGQSSEAAGWIQDLRGDGGSLLAKPDWTELGDQAVKGGRYRLVSPTFNAASAEVLGSNRVRPTELASVALTNAPNMRGLAPLSV